MKDQQLIENSKGDQPDLTATGPSKPCEAISRMNVDSVVLNEHETAISDIQNAQRLGLQCERNHRFGPLTLNHR